MSGIVKQSCSISRLPLSHTTSTTRTHSIHSIPTICSAYSKFIQRFRGLVSVVRVWERGEIPISYMYKSAKALMTYTEEN